MKYLWEDQPGNRLQGEGMSRDISVKGAFIFSPSPPPIGATVELDVAIPGFDAAPIVGLKGEARVLRVKHGAEEGTNGFAVVGQGFTLHGKSDGNVAR